VVITPQLEWLGSLVVGSKFAVCDTVRGFGRGRGWRVCECAEITPKHTKITSTTGVDFRGCDVCEVTPEILSIIECDTAS